MRRVSSPTAPAVACETGRKLAPGLLLSRPRDSRHNSRAGHPGWLRCSSLKYSRYSRSSRLAGRAPRSGTYATNHAAGTLAAARRVPTFAPQLCLLALFLAVLAAVLAVFPAL